MSTVNKHDITKKLFENNCLKSAIKYAKNDLCHENVVAMISGQIIQRQEDEKPDFIIKSQINGLTYITGVEHFMIDRYSKEVNSWQKNSRKKTQSVGRCVDKLHAELAPEYKNKTKLQRIVSIFKDNRQDIVNMINKSLIARFSTGCNMLCESLSAAVRHHSESCHRYYRDNIKAVSSEKDICKTIALIEARIRNDGNNYKYKHLKLDSYKRRFIPQNLLCALEKHESDLQAFDYVILCIYDLAETETKNVIALTPSKIKQQIHDLKIPICKNVEPNVSKETLAELNIQYKQIDGIKTTKEGWNCLKNTIRILSKPWQEKLQSKLQKYKQPKQN